MTDRRAIEGITISYGHPGRATYDTEEKQWTFTVKHDEEQHIRQIQPFEECLPPSIPELPLGKRKLAINSRKQLKSLLKARPELYPGNEVALSLAKDATSAEPDLRGDCGALLAFGKAYDNKHVSEILATSCGEAGHILRLSRCRKEKQGWGDHKEATISVTRPDLSEQGYWMGNGGAIQQIVFAEGDGDSGTWLAARQTALTTVFRPYYGHVQTAFVPNVSALSYPPSRLSPNPVASFKVEETGLLDHVDFAFNPWYARQSVVVDSSGKWCISDVEGAMSRRASQKVVSGRKGCIDDGYRSSLFQQPPQNDPSDGWHRILWICNINTIAVCSRWHVAVFDVKAKAKRLRSIEFSTKSSDRILDVKRSLTSENHLFLLTESRIFWIEVTPVGEKEDARSGAKVLLSYKHFRGTSDEILKLAVLKDDKASVMITSNRTSLTNVFGFSKDTGSIDSPLSWQASFLLSKSSEGQLLYAPYFLPAPLSLGSDIDSEDFMNGIRIFQVWAVTFNLALTCSLCVIEAPLLKSFNLQKWWLAQPNVQSKLSYRRNRSERRTRESFVIPDCLEDQNTVSSHVLSHSRIRAIAEGNKENMRLRVNWGPIFQHIFTQAHAGDQARASRASSPDGFPTVSALISRYGDLLQRAKDSNNLSLVTLFELSDISTFSEELDQATVALHEYLQSLQEEQDTQSPLRLVVTNCASTAAGVNFMANDDEKPPDFLKAYDYLVDSWMASLPQKVPLKSRLSKYKIIRQMAIELCLSSIGISLRDKASELQEGPHPGSKNAGQLQKGQNPERYNLNMLFSPEMTPEPLEGSHLSLPTPTRTPSLYSHATDLSESDVVEDPAVSRLRQYAVSIKSRLNPGESRLLSHWIPGTDPANYSWEPQKPSVGDSGDENGRKKTREASRRRKRAEAFLNRGRATLAMSESQPSFMPSGSQPDITHHTFSSQPLDDLPMTQPDRGHNHGDGEHDHSDDITPALQYSLYQHINFDDITTLNEAEIGSGKAIVKKTWAERLEEKPELETDADEQLLMHIPFTGQVKLHSILIRTSNSSSAPQTLKLFINRDDIDFATASDLAPTQEFSLSQTSEIQDIGVKRALFGKVQNLTLFVEDNYGEDVTRISYLGFKGDWMQLGRAPTNILYEAAANPSDHAVKGTSVNQMGSRLG
ncbi:hypothetical protein G7Y89_g3129 [Cudoniella acicularis]|uniref:PITH domain-containing protein n=1 Tax=Cudoniella acicularis TaxID=354080 RepID=A0A8H4RT84_9HELO|nr:hypothetical protein G7Y89_g3129 [Cudoniella acicularis]